MTEPTDRELLTAIATSDRHALRAFYNRHAGRVYNTALSYLQQPTDAEEVTQDVFAKVWRSAGSFKAEAQVTTWVYRITVNTALTALKKRQRRNIFGQLKEGRDPPDFHHPEARLEEREGNKALFTAIYGLPDRQKTAFVLSYVEELPRQEVADVMHLSRKAVEGLLMRAKKNLRTRLENEHPNRGKHKK